ncbi:MAG TPA: transglycosylase SLT domain-containing protein [Gemmatimonadales bacterium]|nr:transglycosylase SLT domain-containing protein [Gemmatimonadales bacterium]
MTLSTPPRRRSTFARLPWRASLATGLVLWPRLGLTAQTAPLRDTGAIVTAAARALSQGRPFLASRLLAPLLADTAVDPARTLLAARAASGWDGWGTVVRILAGEPWLDRLEGGEGRALLARARVEQGEDAVEDARAAVIDGGFDPPGARLVTLARAFDRANQLDSAARTYAKAAARLPAIGDWLRLRAAGVVADSSDRAALFREISLPAAVSRIRWTEALARERTGDRLGAATVYESLGATLDAIRLRLAAAPDSDRAGRRKALLGVITGRSSGDDAREAIGMLDRLFAPLTPAEELAVARRAATDLPSRAVVGFSRARPLSDMDQLANGMVLARLRRHKEAMAAFAAVRSPQLKTQAQYQRARSLLRTGTRGAAIAALRRVSRGTVRDSAFAATAGFLAGDLLVDQGDETAARTQYLEVARRFPTTPHGSRAALMAAIIAYGQREARDAVRELTALIARRGDHSETAAAIYWAGRAQMAGGDSADARARWRMVLERYPQSFYALPARDRLGLTATPAPITAAPAGPPEATVAALERGALLERLGLRVEARFELDRVSREADSTPVSLAATAQGFSQLGYTARAYKLALRSADSGLARLAFPIPRRADLFDEARLAGVDPLLAAALIRQESGFDPSARSSADARGLMQVVPSVGAAFARADGIKDWDAALLYEPEINVRFGLAHLAASLRRSPHLAHALAAYNAGTRAADEWVALPSARTDPELFIERIQYAETRDYVRRILRNLATYRALYPVTP